LSRHDQYPYKAIASCVFLVPLEILAEQASSPFVEANRASIECCYLKQFWCNGFSLIFKNLTKILDPSIAFKSSGAMDFPLLRLRSSLKMIMPL
jgi:hypothetical protein